MVSTLNITNEIKKLLVFYKEIGAEFVEIDNNFLKSAKKIKTNNIFAGKSEIEYSEPTDIGEQEKLNTISNQTDIKSDTIEKINNEINKCTACILNERKRNYVTGEGQLNPDIMFIGEGPGEQEDRTGKPFVGDAGNLLDKIINKMGYKRENIFIANIVKCRPPNNRTPSLEEAKACLPFLKRQIALVKPRVIVCLGKTATNFLLEKHFSITRVRGTEYNYNSIPVIPTFHPSYILHIKSKEAVSKAKWEVWSDMEKVISILKR